jgi:hypothetical protein
MKLKTRLRFILREGVRKTENTPYPVTFRTDDQ